MIEHFLDGTTISKIRHEVERREGHSPQELAVLALLRHGLEEAEAKRAA